MVRIKDIAKEANVSEGTVDRVLHNRGGVSKKTEEKIRKILERRNYSINPVASALAMKNKHNIAVLIPDYDYTDAFWKAPHLGILKATEEVKNFGVNLSIYKFNQFDPKSYLEAFQSLIKDQPSALIFVPMFLTETSKIVTQLETLNIPYQFLNIDVENHNNLTYVGQDSFTAGSIAGKLMHLSVKANTFLIILSRENRTDNNAISKRIKGFNHYFNKNHIEHNTLTLKVDGFNDKVGLTQSINNFLLNHKNISGIFVPSSRVSAVAESLKSNSPATLIGFDNTPQNITCLQQETVSFLISQKPFEQGYESVRIMADFLVKSKIPKQKVYLPIDILLKENVSYNDMSQTLFEEAVEV